MKYPKVDDVLSNFNPTIHHDPMKSIKSITDPKRETPLQHSEVEVIQNTIKSLETSNINIEKLFVLFDDWQTKRTLTTKRTFLSFSMIISVATWTEVDYSSLSFFGLKMSDGSISKFLFFILMIIVSSGIFMKFLEE